MLVTNEDQAQEVIRYVQGTECPLIVDTETDGLEWWKSKIVGWCIGTTDREFYFPIRHKEGYNLPESVSRQIATTVVVPSRLQVGHNYGFDIKMGMGEDMRMPVRIIDTMITAHLMNENEEGYKLEYLAELYLGEGYAAAEDELVAKLVAAFGGSPKKAKQHLHRLPATDVWRYGCQDIRTTRELERFYAPEITQWKVQHIADELYEFQLMLVQMELRGVPVNKDALKALGEKAEPKAAELELRLQQMARADLGDPDFPANPRSHPQMKMWLSKMIGVPDTKAATLQLADDERGNLLLEYRTWQKLRSSFCTPYWGFIAPDGRIHANMWICSPGTREGKDLHGTVSGRLSMTRPNLQQVPPAAKHLFEASEGHVLVELDYSQAELRWGAHYYWTLFQDPNLANLLAEGKDIHQATADEAGLPRKSAKMRNFAIAYGAGAKRLAYMFQSPVAREKEYLAKYHRLFPGNRKLSNFCMAQAEKYGYIRMWTGRTRRFNCVRAGTYKAGNNKIQGATAEMVRRAGVQCWKQVPEAKLLLQIHDSYLFEIPEAEWRPIVRRLRAIMQDVPECELPMVVDAKVGPNWGEMQELPRDPIGIPSAVLAKCTDPTLLPAKG